MSYKISYAIADKLAKHKARHGVRAMAVLVIALAVVARFVYPEETKQLAEALFPLSSDSSQQALKVFSESIRAGESFGDAVTAFCWEIIHEPEIS